MSNFSTHRERQPADEVWPEREQIIVFGEPEAVIAEHARLIAWGCQPFVDPNTDARGHCRAIVYFDLSTQGGQPRQTVDPDLYAEND